MIHKTAATSFYNDGRHKNRQLLGPDLVFPALPFPPGVDPVISSVQRIEHVDYSIGEILAVDHCPVLRTPISPGYRATTGD